jgi:N-succinyldiaminopimelate aminotransferase
LLDAHAPGGEVVHMTIGEPKHAFPVWVGEVIAAHASNSGATRPMTARRELLEAIGAWLARRFGVNVRPTGRSWR